MSHGGEGEGDSGSSSELGEVALPEAEDEAAVGTDATPLIPGNPSSAGETLRSAVSRAAQKVKQAEAKGRRMFAGSAEPGEDLCGTPTAPYLSPASEEEINCSCHALGIAGAVALGGLVIGFDTEVFAAVAPGVYSFPEFNMHASTRKVLFVAVPVVAALSSIVIGPVASVTRRGSLLCSSSIFFFAAVMAAGARNIGTMLIARVLFGVAVGLWSVAGPLYVAEVSPEGKRGRMVCLAAVAAALGHFLAVIAVEVLSGWRTLLGVVTIPALVQFIVLVWQPESPLLLTMNGDTRGAEKVLELLHPGCDSPAVTAALHSVLCARKDQGGLSRHPRAVLIGCSVMAIQQLLVLNAAVSASAPFTARSLADSGDASDGVCSGDAVPPRFVRLLTAAGAMVVGAVAGCGFVDSLGRRGLFLVGLLSNVLAFGLLSFVPSDGWAAAAAQMVLVTSQAAAVGLVPYVLCLELFPVEMRDRGVALCSSVRWAFAAGAPHVMLATCGLVGSNGLAKALGAVALIGTLLLFWALPETRGKDLMGARVVVTSVEVRDALLEDDTYVRHSPPPPSLVAQTNCRGFQPVSATEVHV
eukprot:Hpha_TRINITY_DN11139_c0_g1::TRINITY_DN11139_c0_g1_i2::g.28090::m.28090